VSVSSVALPVERPAPPSIRRARGATVAGAVFVLAFAALALFGGRLAPYRATALSGRSLEGPSTHHLLGTNLLGQDVLSQLIRGTGVSVGVALLAGAGTVVLGGLIGISAGWFGGAVDEILMRFTDIVMVLPRLPMLLLVGALVGGGVLEVGIVIALLFWPLTARVLRSQVLSLRSRTYVRASTGFGSSSWHQLRRHVLPELSLLGMAELVRAAAQAVVIQAGLAFLGIGNPTLPSWGSMIRDAIAYRSLFLTPAWKWWLLPPVVAIVILVSGITLLGTAAERRLDPRLTRHRS
jgi:ABC-type dipeptide/oligopeptide/nickel transport system permease subunit